MSQPVTVSHTYSCPQINKITSALSKNTRKKCLQIHTFSSTKGDYLDGTNHFKNIQFQSHNFVKISRDHNIISSKSSVCVLMSPSRGARGVSRSMAAIAGCVMNVEKARD